MSTRMRVISAGVWLLTLLAFLFWLAPHVRAQGTATSLCYPFWNAAGNRSCIPVGMTGVGNAYNWLPVGGLANAAAPTYTEGLMGGLSLDLSGNLRTSTSPASQYPLGATPITASATGTTGATTATLAGTSGKTTYICGYSIRANATAAATVTNTITGVITATLSSIMWIAPLASGIGIDEQIFSPCIPASASNTGIAIVSGAPGSGGTVSSKGWGYQL